MKQSLFIITLFSILTLAACGSSVEKLNNDGNEAFSSQNYEAALAAYQQAQSQSPEMPAPHYNAANVHYRTQNFEQAQQELEQTLVKDNGNLSQNSYYNLGNTFFQNQQFEHAIEAYKETLRLNPDDVEAKHNLELALQQLQQQQQDQQDEQQQDQQNDQQGDQQQDQQDGQQQDQQNEQQSDQQQDQQGEQQQDQQNDQQGNQQQDQQDGQQQDQQNDQQDSPQQPGQKDEGSNDGQGAGQPQLAEGLTEEQARQLFEAATQDTKSLEEYLQQVLVVPGGQPAQDW